MKVCSFPKQNIHAGNLILVNREYGYRENKDIDLAAIRECGDGIRMERHASLLLSELMKKIGGWNEIVPVSGWRSMGEQREIWDGSLAENGPDFTKKFVAVPGHSEHQTGLAIDLGLKQKDINFICPEFPYSGICQTFRLHAASYGFVERYPAGKETVTGIWYEPWHFRYVGVPHSLVMNENGLTLEEYMEFMKAYPYGDGGFCYKQNGLEAGISYLRAASTGNTRLEINTETPYSVSGNNVDGFIVTEWRGTNGNKTAIRQP